jgi:hypothetical protein
VFVPARHCRPRLCWPLNRCGERDS